MGITLLFLGKLDDAARHLQQVRVSYDRQKHVLPEFMSLADSGVVSRIFLAWTLQLQDRPDQASALDVQAGSLARELAQPPTSALALHVGGIFRQIRGEHAVVSERSEALVKLAVEQAFAHFVGTGTFFRGWTMTKDGAVQEGLAEMRRGLAAKRATGAEIKVPYYLGLLADAETAAGRPAMALALLAEALDKVEQTDERWFAAELWRLRGETLLRVDALDCSEADGCFQRAIELAQAQGAAWWELRAAHSLAHLWEEKGEQQRGRDLLASLHARLAKHAGPSLIQGGRSEPRHPD